MNYVGIDNSIELLDFIDVIRGYIKVEIKMDIVQKIKQLDKFSEWRKNDTEQQSGPLSF